MKNLYKLDVEDCIVLSSKVEKVQSREIDELWHRRLGHLHHRALNIMQQISTGLPRETHAKGVPWGSTKKPHSMIRTTKHMHSLKGSTLMSVDLSRQPPLRGTNIMLSLYMTSHESVGSSSCGRRMKHSPSL